MASLQLCDGYLLFKPSVSPRFLSQRISHRLLPKASSASPPPSSPSSSSSSSSSSSLSFTRRELLYQSAAVSLSLSSIVGPVNEAKAEEQLSEWERVYLPIDPGVVLLDIAFVPDEPSRGFLLGTRQTLLETKDSGNTWNPRSIPSAEEEDFSYRFNSISFKGKEGWISVV